MKRHLVLIVTLFTLMTTSISVKAVDEFNITINNTTCTDGNCVVNEMNNSSGNVTVRSESDYTLTRDF